MAASSRSASIVELRRMFSNLDSTVIESVLVANGGKVDVTIDHLLTMSIDTENANNIQQVLPTTPLRQLPAVMNIYEDDPPPYPGHEAMSSNHASAMPSLPQRSPSIPQPSHTVKASENASIESDIQVRRWKTAYGQYRICYTGDLSNDFLRVELSLIDDGSHSSKVKRRMTGNHDARRSLDAESLSILFQNEEFLGELRHNPEFLSTLHEDQSIRSITSPSSTQQRSLLHHQPSTKPLPLPTPPTIEMPKTPKVRARMLQNVLTQIEQGQTTKPSMVPEESVTQDEGYSYGKDNKERMSLPMAPMLGEFDPLRTESNEEFIGRLKNMGKNSMDKFNQLARRFTMRKGPTASSGRYSRQPMIFNNSGGQHFNNEFDHDEDALPSNKTDTSRYLASV